MHVCRLRNTRLQAELDTTKSRAAAAELKLVEKLEQASTEITLLHHTLRGLTDELHAALNEQVTPPYLPDSASPVKQNAQHVSLCLIYLVREQNRRRAKMLKDPTAQGDDTPPAPSWTESWLH